MKRGNLDFVMLKPDRFLQLGSFELDMVETEWLVNVGMGNGIDGQGYPAMRKKATRGQHYFSADWVCSIALPAG